jgi:hypothetical protein
MMPMAEVDEAMMSGELYPPHDIPTEAEVGGFVQYLSASAQVRSIYVFLFFWIIELFCVSVLF